MSKTPLIEIPAVKRSNKNLSHPNRFSTQPGLLNVCYTQLCLPGDHFKIRPYVQVETLPLKAPLLGQLLVQTDFYFVPFRLYRAEMRSNARKLFTNSTTSMDYELPTFRMDSAFTSNDGYNVSGLPPTFGGETTDTGRLLEAYAIKNNSLLNQIGFPIGYMDASSASTAPGVPGDKRYLGHLLLAYYDIFRNYYANTQESDFYVRHARYPNNLEHLPIVPFSLQILDNFYQGANPNPQTLYNYFFSVISTLPGFETTLPRVAMEGLCYRTYKNDYYSNWISKNAYDGIAQSFGRIVTSDDGSFTINQFRLGNRLLKRAEKILAFGGRYGDYIRSLFTVNTSSDLDIPEYIGGSLTTLDFQSIPQTTANTDEYDPATGKYPLGASASKGTAIDTLGRINVTCDDYGYIIGICSIIPKPDYSTGVPREFTNRWLSDFYDPSLDRVGWQAIYKSEFDALLEKDSTQFLSWFGGRSTDPFGDEAGVAYQPAFMELETRTGRNYGLLGLDLVFPEGQQGNLNFWTLNRNFRRSRLDSSSGMNTAFNGSTYIFPGDYAVSFVDSSFDAQNFVVQYFFEVKAKRPKGKKLMPSIG